MSQFDDPELEELLALQQQQEKKETMQLAAEVVESFGSGQVEIMEEGIGKLEGIKLSEEIEDKPPMNASSSRSGVRFFGLVYEDKNGMPGEKPIPVFVKKLPIYQLEREVKAHQVLERIGIRHFPPLAVVRADSEVGYLITRKVEITPLSGLDFGSLGTFRRVVEKACIEIQKMHDEGLYHFDLEPKNIGVDPQGNIYIYDFQDSTLHDFPLPKEKRDDDIGKRFLGKLKTGLEVHNKYSKADFGVTTWYEGRELEVEQIINELKERYTVPSVA